MHKVIEGNNFSEITRKKYILFGWSRYPLHSKDFSWREKSAWVCGLYTVEENPNPCDY